MLDKKLERQPWYFGFLSRREVFRHLTEVGDWCVRSTITKGHEESILVVYSEEKRQREFNLKFYKNGDQQGYGFANLPRTTLFPTIVDLVEHFKNNAVLPKGYKLLKAVPRPPIMLREEQVEFEKKKLGQGNYAEVMKGFFVDKDGKKIPVAIKQSKTDILKDVASMERDDRKATLRKIKVLIEQMTTEARLLRGVNHDNVVKIYGISCDKLPIQVVVELCPGGSLFDHIQNMKEKISVDELNIFLLEIARGLRFLQLSKVLHRDVAARNCLIGYKGQVVISDFGLSKPYEELKDDDDGVQMAIPWMAPETLSRHPRFSVKSDVYSFGVVVHELYTFGGKPWPEHDVDAVITIVRSGKKMKPPDNMPENVRNLMNDCWNRKPSERPDFVTVVRRLRHILEEGKIPDPQSRSVAHIPEIKLTAFNLNDETDLAIVEYSCISEDPEDDLSSQHRRGRSDRNKNSEKLCDSSGSARRRKSSRKLSVHGSSRNAPPSTQNNDTDQEASKEEEEGEGPQTGSNKRVRKRSKKTTEANTVAVVAGKAAHKRQATGPLIRKTVSFQRKAGQSKVDPKGSKRAVSPGKTKVSDKK